MEKRTRIALVLAGVLALVLKSRLVGPAAGLAFDYGGNVAASFAVFFLVTLVPVVQRYGPLAAAGVAAFVVEVFEATDGFAVLSNVYDRGDFLANLVGIALALMVEAVLRVRSRGGDGSSGSGFRDETFSAAGWRSARITSSKKER